MLCQSDRLIGVRQSEVAAVEAFGGQHGQRDRPTLAHRSEPVVVVESNTVEIDLVERTSAGHLPDRANTDARRIHRHQEHGETGMFRCARVGSAHRDADLGDACARGPHLVALDRPRPIGRPDGPGTNGCQIGSGLGFREQLTRDDVGPQHGAHIARPLFVGSPLLDRGSHQLLGHREHLGASGHIEARFGASEGKDDTTWAARGRRISVTSSAHPSRHRTWRVRIRGSGRCGRALRSAVQFSKTATESDPDPHTDSVRAVAILLSQVPPPR